MKISTSVDLTDFLDENMDVSYIVDCIKQGIIKEATKELKASGRYKALVKQVEEALFQQAYTSCKAR